jgi:hypothetical protein
LCGKWLFGMPFLMAIENQSARYVKNNRQARIYVKKSPFAILFFDNCIGVINEKIFYPLMLT